MFWSLIVRDDLKDVRKTKKRLLGFSVSNHLSGKRKRTKLKVCTANF